MLRGLALLILLASHKGGFVIARFEDVFNHPMTKAVKHYEGLSLSPYRCPAGKWTIGYGHLCPADRPPISPEEAERLLRRDMLDALAAVLRQWPEGKDAPTHQLAALTSFVFNLGEGNFASSTLLRRLKARDLADVPAQIRRWNKITINGVKKRLAGLVKRRECEARCFASGEVIINNK